MDGTEGLGAGMTALIRALPASDMTPPSTVPQPISNAVPANSPPVRPKDPASMLPNPGAATIKAMERTVLSGFLPPPPPPPPWGRATKVTTSPSPMTVVSQSARSRACPL